MQNDGGLQLLLHLRNNDEDEMKRATTMYLVDLRLEAMVNESVTRFNFIHDVITMSKPNFHNYRTCWRC